MRTRTGILTGQWMSPSFIARIVSSTVMNLDASWLLLSLIPGGAGFVLFVYGKKQQRYPHLIAGLAMMGYPYFTTTVTSMTVVGVAIGAALWYAVRLGW
jgi:hypothetical protein